MSSALSRTVLADAAAEAIPRDDAATTLTLPQQAPVERPAGRVRRPYLVALPDREPPFDDELEAARQPARVHSRRWAAETRAADPSTSAALPARAPATGPGAAAVLPARAPATGPGAAVLPARMPATEEPVRIQVNDVPAWSHEADMGVRRTGTAALPAAQRSASMLARALVEVLSGQRAVAQLRVHCSAEVFAGLAGRPAPSSVALAHLLSVHVSEPADGVAEVSTVFRRAGRARAVAFRLQGVDGRWRITALQVG